MLLKDLGFVRSSGMGAVSIPYSEIQSFLNLYSLELTAWEITLIHTLSAHYADQHMLSADKEGVTAPNALDMTDDHRARVAKALEAYFFKKDKKKKE